MLSQELQALLLLPVPGQVLESAPAPAMEVEAATGMKEMMMELVQQGQQLAVVVTMVVVVQPWR